LRCRRYPLVARANWSRINNGVKELIDQMLVSHLLVHALDSTESLDVMGDGSLVLLPTPGHTAGSVSLLIRRTGRPPLLAGTTYGAEILQRDQLPGRVGCPDDCRALPSSDTRYLAGSESGAGVRVNDVAPGHGAELLCAAKA
jgi:glyoxylase-like metal-dependent hydrolase (beta-lactamase superfamily II)